MTDLDDTYNRVLELQRQAERIAEEAGPIFAAYSERAQYKFNPFRDVIRELRRAREELRISLIRFTAEQQRERLTPNLKPDVDFNKLMDQEAGEEGFREDVITTWFLFKVSDPEALKRESVERLRDLARRLIPYGRGPQGWGLVTEISAIQDGRRLRLKAYTWDAHLEMVNTWTYHDGELAALERIIDVATKGTDPTRVSTTWGLSDFLAHTSVNDPSTFYLKVQVHHPAVTAFRFFKNGTLIIEFQTEEQARKAAALILGVA